MSGMFWNVDWHGIFTSKNSLLEMVVRGTIMYFVIFGLMPQLRENGIEDCSLVKRACMEADGMISFIKMGREAGSLRPALPRAGCE